MSRLIGLLLAALFATTAGAQVPKESRLGTIANTKVIKVAYRTDARPFSFVDGAQAPTGYSVDLCKLVVGSIERQLGKGPLKTEWVGVNVETRFAAVMSAKADMECGSSSITLGRMKDVEFSNVIFVESTGLIVGKNSNIRTFADLAGKKIAVAAKTTNERAILDSVRQHKVEATLVSVSNGAEALALLESGQADAFASDKLLLVGAHLKNPQSFMMLPDDLSFEPYAITLPRGDWAMRLAVNRALSEIYRSGQVVSVFQRWFEPIGLQVNPILRIVYALGSLPE